MSFTGTIQLAISHFLHVGLLVIQWRGWRPLRFTEHRRERLVTWLGWNYRPLQHSRQNGRHSSAKV